MAKLSMFSQVVALSTLLGISVATDYCQFSPEHALCGDTGIGPNCNNDEFNVIEGLTQQEKDELLDIHNQLRSKVALGNEELGSPGPQYEAANMRQMVWDDELASIAQAHTNKCNFAHDCYACRRTNDTMVGQNIRMSSTSRKNTSLRTAAAIKRFYREVKDVDREMAKSYKFHPKTGHYTQVVWAKSDRLGCGHIQFKSGRWYKKLLTCNYAVAGNFGNQPIYKVGKACSDCGAGYKCSSDYEGLCVKE